MLINAAVSPYARVSQPSIQVNQEVSSQPATPVLDQVQFSAASPEDDSDDGKIKWGPALGVIGGVGLTAGVAAAGFGWASAVPAFALGGAAGLAITAIVADKALSNGRDSSGTGPIVAFVSVLGGIGSAIGAASLALNHGSPTVGLGFGLAATALMGAAGAYTYSSPRNG